MCVMDFWGGEIHFVFWFKWTMIEIPIWKGDDTNDIGTPRSPVGSHSFVRPRPSRFSNVLKSLRPWNALEGGLPFSGITVDFQISSRLSLLKKAEFVNFNIRQRFDLSCTPTKMGNWTKKAGYHPTKCWSYWNTGGMEASNETESVWNCQIWRHQLWHLPGQVKGFRCTRFRQRVYWSIVSKATKGSPVLSTEFCLLILSMRK